MNMTNKIVAELVAIGPDQVLEKPADGCSQTMELTPQELADDWILDHTSQDSILRNSSFPDSDYGRRGVAQPDLIKIGNSIYRRK